MLNEIVQEKKVVPKLEVFYLMDEDEAVEVEEVAKLDFRRIEAHLKKGESIFITPKRRRKLNMNFIVEHVTEEPWYFSHV
ncbi:MAG: hypothetical protein JSV51_09260 [Candidatus Bathyarchaeota archaeon]|nr:MAG: hypothetical protein JSV51_09260 [Candidatus Bathyarchaeota archaeon]